MPGDGEDDDEYAWGMRPGSNEASFTRSLDDDSEADSSYEEFANSGISHNNRHVTYHVDETGCSRPTVSINTPELVQDSVKGFYNVSDRRHPDFQPFYEEDVQNAMTNPQFNTREYNGHDTSIAEVAVQDTFNSEWPEITDPPGSLYEEQYPDVVDLVGTADLPPGRIRCPVYGCTKIIREEDVRSVTTIFEQSCFG
jgi:hypothetical protein